jgi:hypothetical protein
MASGSASCGDRASRVAQRRSSARLRKGNERDGRRLDDVAVLDGPLAADGPRVSGDRVGREFHGSKGKDEQAGPASERNSRLLPQPHRGVELPRQGQVEQRHVTALGQHHHIARRRQSDAGLDSYRLAPRQREIAHLQAGNDSGAARARHVGLALADIILIAGEVGAGQETPVEIVGTAAQAVQDERPRPELVLEILAGEQSAAL